MWMELTKLAPFDKATPSPKKTVSSSEMGTYLASMRNDKPRLVVLPRVTRVVVIPDAIPLRCAGTEFITAVLLGAANIPMPAPIKTRGVSNCTKLSCC